MTPIDLNIIRAWPDGFTARMEHVWKDLVGFIPNYKLYDLQRMLAEFGFRMEVFENARPLASVADMPRWVCLEGMNKDELDAYDYGCRGMEEALRQILDGKDPGAGTSNEPWETLRRRVLALVEDAERYRFLRAKSGDFIVERHRDGWATSFGRKELDAAIDAARGKAGA